MARVLGVPAALLLLGLANPGARAAVAISRAEGDVQQRLGQDAPWQAPVEGALLADGTQIKTGPAGRAELVLDDGSLLELGSRALLVLRSVAAPPWDFKLDGGMLIAKLQPQAAARVSAAGSFVSGRGARFLVESVPGAVRARAFLGQVAFRKGGGKEVPVPEGRAMKADESGLSPQAPAAAVKVSDSDWLLEPPRGFSGGVDEDGLPGWKRSWQDSLSLSGVTLTIRHSESVTVSFEDIDWGRGQPWPQDCRRANREGNAIAAGGVRRESVAGLPAFAYVCSVPGGLKYQDRSAAAAAWKVSPGERHRFRDVAVDYDGSAARHALWARYSHIEEVADIPGLDAEQMDNVRRLVGMTAGADRDGPGADAYFEMLETLRLPTAPHATSQPRAKPQSAGAVPLLR